MRIEEGEHLLRLAAEIVVAVLETVRRVLDPVQLLLLARYKVEDGRHRHDHRTDMQRTFSNSSGRR